MRVYCKETRVKS